jgi:hypothetical protein
MNFVLQQNSLKRVTEKKLHSCNLFIEHYFLKETLPNNMSDLLENPVVYTGSSEERLHSSSSDAQTVTTTATPVPHQTLLYSVLTIFLFLISVAEEKKRQENVSVPRCSSLPDEESSSCRNVLCIYCVLCVVKRWENSILLTGDVLQV